ncbi:FG-GAP-like repeat-containing protein [Engelhardtia mirabilis]|uniref:FG-GAP repeat protein n=1 Tax=Engelhardtia mirabilis TaxID=2528011 RepID=A0A518BNC2_9BACT|nr:FG-GAP repeat protein [Planctomycetes bacterium Pla133]QDV02786.1 FG-GAP repeat protein [Planctomycetes bacterium Pla86]
MRCTLFALAASALLAAPALAQLDLGGRHLFSIEGEVFLGRFGWDVAAGDVDGDGYTDLIAGAPSEPVPGTPGGRVRIYSGRDGLLLRELSPMGAQGDFGEAVAALGDLNGDGAIEVGVGAPEAQAGGEYPGRVHVYDGATGALLAALAGGEWFDAFGQSLTNLGDVDLDGVEDFAVGAPRPQTQGPFLPGPGSVRVYSGATLSPFGTLFGTNDYDRFGEAVGAAGDVNQDGHPDLVVGAPGFDSGGFNGNGRVVVVSGEWIASSAAGFTPLSPQVLAGVDGDFDGGALGFAVAGVGDTNGDGFPDVLAGGPNSNLNGALRGVADLISGEWITATSLGLTPTTPKVLDRFAGEQERDLFGRSVSALGDVDGDGRPDFVIGASESVSPGPGPGYATIYSGATSDDIATYRGGAGGDRVGWALDGGAADFDGDGVLDLALGADIGSGAINGVGTAHMLSGRELLLSADAHLLSSSAGGTQTFLLDATNTSAGDAYLLLGSLSGTDPGTPLPLGAGTLPLNVDGYFGLTLTLSMPLLGAPFGVLDQGGEALASFSIGAGSLPPAATGLTVHHAYVALDLGAGGAITTVSNAVPTTIVP